MAGFWTHQVLIFMIPGQSCKEKGFLDYLSVSNRAQMTVPWVGYGCADRFSEIISSFPTLHLQVASSRGGLRAILAALCSRLSEGGRVVRFLGAPWYPADSSVQISANVGKCRHLLSIRFLAQNASPRVASSGRMISESSSIR